MAWNDFLATVQQDTAGISDITSYVRSIASDAGLVSVAPAPTGNMTAEQIAQGQTGNQTPLHPAQNGNLAQASNAFGFSLPAMGSMLPILAVAGVVLFFVLKKGRK